jgi:hypothetical protein
MGQNWSNDNCYVTTRYNKKFTVILDLDLTLIGNITPLANQNYILNTFFNKSITTDEIYIALKSGLLRPYVKEFIHELLKHNVNIVIYTMSTEEWAKKVISALYRVIGMNFVTLLLTRQNCTNTGKKSITYAIEQLQQKGHSALMENTIMIDDTHNIIDATVYNTIYVSKYIFTPKHFLLKYTSIKNILQNKELYNKCLELELINQNNLEQILTIQTKDINNNSLYDDVFLKLIKKLKPDHTYCRSWVE